ncbi:MULTISPECIES: fumarylacetoacetate hydrolase family protein [unclassified Acidiphilium]|uniref:fumarylacetoacetate hydrolase family protein n=1 Tax=unclassified Acidiphilium TaxID=2617493 RepID=UPI000BD1D7BA|nr:MULTISPECIES: fumarylacetoacetate hydrolase family protein [unclassified Acidiphilium]OYV57614.1 MAG: 2-hydroxyhepta-2,4-diene-1,7-dioate isomerase [Acidiphilium sp. 20-67-58]HQT62005.1 fumarylacetoacetate hydrolase family protein [Acidiphilium sp.]
MKLFRHGAVGAERPGIVDGSGALRDLSGVIAEIDAATLSDAGLARLAALDAATLPLVPAGTRIGAPVPRPVNFICIGLNYADHAAESGLKVPEEPIIFIKAGSAYSGPNDDIVIPPGAKETDWEVELGVIIGTGGSHIAEDSALDHVAGYCIVNDVSEREYQIRRGGTWDKGKGCPSFGPTGPFLVTRDEVPDPQALDLWCEVDGKRMQNGNTRTMIFGVKTLVSYVSRFIHLQPGDVIATGTPPGVGMGIKPEPVFLRPGQTVRLGIAGLGEQTQKTIGG